METITLRYPDHPADFHKEVADEYIAFIAKVRELEEAGVKSWVENSY
jgi:hypothetical protein